MSKNISRIFKKSRGERVCVCAEKRNKINGLKPPLCQPIRARLLPKQAKNNKDGRKKRLYLMHIKEVRDGLYNSDLSETELWESHFNKKDIC